MFSFPFDHHFIELPSGDDMWLAMGLTAIPDAYWRRHLQIVQPWRSSFLAFQRAGFATHARIPHADRSFSGGILELTKYKALNQKLFFELVEQVGPNQPLIIYGAKNFGAQSFAKWVSHWQVIDGSQAKRHGLVFWLQAGLLRPAVNNAAHNIMVDDFITQPGMFSHGKIDSGSALLAHFFSDDITGRVADLGAGWGYLAVKLLHAAPRVTAIDLFEANYDALMAAKHHVEKSSDIALSLNWCDIANEPLTGRYDTIITNPPFHDGQISDPNLGQKFIMKAASHLTPGGFFYMVANQHLPYEKTLNNHFKKVTVLAQERGFKVFKAQK